MANALVLLFLYFKIPKRLIMYVASSVEALINWFRKRLEAWKQEKSPPATPEEPASLIVETLDRDPKEDVEGLLTSYGLPLISIDVVGTALPEGVKYEMDTLPVDPRSVPDGDGVTVYVSTADPRESSYVPTSVQVAAVLRAQARVQRNYARADELQQEISNYGYRVIYLSDKKQEILARKYRIRLRGIDAPENSMPYGEEAKEALVKIVRWKPLKVLVYGEDQYERCVADVYCDGKFVQELLLKEGHAWHYTKYDQRQEFAQWEKQARIKRIGLWSLSNPEKPWEWRKRQREGINRSSTSQRLPGPVIF